MAMLTLKRKWIVLYTEPKSLNHETGWIAFSQNCRRFNPARLQYTVYSILYSIQYTLYSILTLLKFDYKIRVLYRVNSMYWCSSVACHTINFTYLGWISPLDDQCSSFCSGSEGEFIFYGLKTKICFVILVLAVKQPKILFDNSCTGSKTTKDSVW